MKSYEIKAYIWKDAKNTLAEFGSGFSFRHADQYFKRLRDTNKFSMITMEEI